MDAIHQFWWNWWVNAIVAIATFAAVLIALFGEYFRSKLFSPKLELKLLCAEGEKGKIKHAPHGAANVRFEDARYYHVKVFNKRGRVSIANNVQVFLIRTEEPDQDEQLKVTWVGEVPMRWRDQQISPLTQTIGHAVDCDLCTVGKDKWLSLSPLIVPYTLNAHRQDKCTMVVWLQARSDQADSPVVCIKVSWDGSWEDGDDEMKRHLVVSQLSANPTT